MAPTTGNKPFFARPIELSDTLDNRQFSVQKIAEPVRTISIDAGVYSSIMAVMYAIEDACNESAFGLTDGVTTTLTLVANSDNTDVAIKWAFSASTTLTLTVDANFKTLVGAADDSYTGALEYTMDYRPEYCWVPTYQNANQNRWLPVHKDLFAGTMGKTGIVAGIATGPTVYYKDLTFTNEPAVNVFEDAATIAHHSKKHIDYFVRQSLQSYPTDTAYPSTKGFFYFDDWQQTGNIPGGTDGTTTTSMGINFNLASSPDRFAYCQFDPSGLSAVPTASAPSGITYYNVRFRIHTIETMPTWEDPENDE